jgi:hypothetical protein
MTKISLILVILYVSLFGNTNPNLYALLGNKLFDAGEKLEKFKSIDTLSIRIKTYQEKSKLVLNEGVRFESDGTISAEEKKQYLKLLRNLEGLYVNIVGSLQQKLLDSIKNSDYNLFSSICKSELEDIFNNSNVQQQAIAFYQDNKSNGRIEILEKLQKERIQTTQAKEKKQPKPSIEKKFTMEINSYKDNSVQPYEMKHGITLEECKELCLKDKRCQSMIMNIKTQKCWLKESVGRVFESRYGILGIKKTF